MLKTRVQPLGWEGPLEKKMATHSSTLALKIPWVEEPGRLQSMGSQRVRHDWATSLSQGLALSSLLVYIFKGLLWMKSEAVCACMTTWNSFFKLFLSKAEFLSIHLPYTHTSLHISASLVAQSVKNPPAKQETRVRSLGWEDPLEKKMATHSSIFAWEIPWTEESGGLQSVKLQESDTIERLNHLHISRYIHPYGYMYA